MGSSVFSGGVALISGAGSGIGLELARAFGRAGAAVVGTDINAERIGKLVAELKAQGVSAFGYRVDHAKGEEVEALAARVTAEVGPVDILCPNAGVGHMGKIGSIPEKEWRWVLDINLWGIIHMVNVFIPSMIERKRGWVLITASGAGLTPIALAVIATESSGCSAINCSAWSSARSRRSSESGAWPSPSPRVARFHVIG